MKKLILLPLLLAATALHAEQLVKSVEFTATPAPRSDAERTEPFTRSSVIVTYQNGSIKKFPLSYNVLYRSSDRVGNWQAGAIVDKSGQLIERSAPDAAGNVAQGPFFHMRRTQIRCCR